MTGNAAVVDIAGSWMGGAARFAGELDRYLARTGRADIRVIGAGQGVEPGWLVRRELARYGPAKRVAVNNVSFVAPGGERWVLLRNALHFLTEAESDEVNPVRCAALDREAAVVRWCARRADVVVVPCTAMAERVAGALPGLRQRLVIRPHPVSADSLPRSAREPAILCPILFSPYKRMGQRLAELATALRALGGRATDFRIRVTALREDVPSPLAADQRFEFLGRLSATELRAAWASTRAVYFPTALESFGYPLAEARVIGHPVIALDTAQNREIAGAALCGYQPGDASSLCGAVERALACDVEPDPAPFDPQAYFDWLLGPSR